MSELSQSVKLENVKLENVKLATWGETIKNLISFQFFENHSEFLAGVIVGSIMTMSGFKYRNYSPFL